MKTKLKIIDLIALALIVFLAGLKPVNSSLPAASDIGLLSKSGCPDPGNPNGWYGNGATNGKQTCFNNVWTDSAANVVISQPISSGQRIPAQDKDEKLVYVPTNGMNFYVLVMGPIPSYNPPGEPYKPLVLHPEYIATQLTEWGFHPSRYEIHIEWIHNGDPSGMDCGGHEACATAMPSGQGFRVRMDSVYPSLFGGFKTIEQYYSSILNFELSRVMVKEVQHGDWAVDTTTSEIFLKYAWKPSKYPYFQRQ